MLVVHVRCVGGDADKKVKFLFKPLVNAFDLLISVFIDCSTVRLDFIDFYAVFFSKIFLKKIKNLTR